MIVIRIACLSVLLFAGCLSGAEITGETKVPPYKLVRLAVKDAPPKAGLLWRVRGSGAIDYAGPRNQPTLLFVAPPGVYQVEATIGTIGKDGVLLLDAVEVSVTIEGQSPAPIPPTPTPPNLTGIAKVSYDASRLVDAAARTVQGPKLATKHRALAGVIRAGGLSKPEDFLSEWRVGNNQAVTATAWKPWAEAVSKELQAMYGAGKLETPGSWADAFDAIAAGLEAQ